MPRKRLRPPTPDELLTRIERLEGKVAQLLAQQTSRSLQPTWRDLEPIKKDVQRVKEKLGIDDC